MSDAALSPPENKGGGESRGLSPITTLLSAVALAGLFRALGSSSPAAPRPVRVRAPATAASPLPPEALQPGRGRTADIPTEIPPRGWWDIAMRVYDEIFEDRILAVAAGVAFYALLALFPAIGAFVALYGLIADTATIADHLKALSDILPSGAIEIIGAQVSRLLASPNTTLGVTFFTGLGISLWSANAGMKAMFDALNVAYQEAEKRNIVMLNIWSLGFTFAALVFIAIAMSAIVVIPVVLKFLWLGAATEWIMWVGRWPVLFLVTLAAITILYRYGPSRRRAQWIWLSPGAIFATVGWIIVSMLFSWYVASFGSYNEAYGSLGAVIGFMTWMWLSSIVVLVGAEISAETEHQTARDTTEGGPRPIGRRGARMADSVGRAR
jgi:membrane protein